jgi:DNA-binding NarL/FixJ family response regulator
MIAPASTFTLVRRPGLDQPMPLTPAEESVLTHLLAGLSNKEIASALGKAEPTVKHQVSSILHKHRVPSRARLLAILR